MSVRRTLWPLILPPRRGRGVMPAAGSKCHKFNDSVLMTSLESLDKRRMLPEPLIQSYGIFATMGEHG